jgi:hypothetical protein
VEKDNSHQEIDLTEVAKVKPDRFDADAFAQPQTVDTTAETVTEAAK